MKEINFSGKNSTIIFLVDDEDFERVKKIKWYLQSSGYVRNSKNKYLHHFIIGKPQKGYEVNHKNLNKLDNTKTNLEFLTIKENRQKKKIYIPSKLKYKFGKYAYKLKNGRYQAQVRVKGRSVYLGNFNTIIEASKIGQIYRDTIDNLHIIQKTAYA